MNSEKITCTKTEHDDIDGVGDAAGVIFEAIAPLEWRLMDGSFEV